MSPDTSAQDAPVASQEAEAREAVVRAGWSFGGPNRGPGGRASLTAINKAIDAYAAVIRASERERHAALVEGVRAWGKTWESAGAGLDDHMLEASDD